MSVYIIPVFILGIFVYAIWHGVNTYDSFVEGARSAIKLIVGILPFLAAILVAVQLFAASGLLDLLSLLARPIFDLVGIPHELTPFIMIKPFSGGGSVALFEQIVIEHGPDSYITRVAGIVAGSSETIFYISAVYFSKTKIKNLGAAIPIALLCTFLAAVLGALVVRWMM
ncbi:MAG: spore maturation protein [Firmicutes bacterium]|nr:spore maturation protein [Bacillota bacterium]